MFVDEPGFKRGREVASIHVEPDSFIVPGIGHYRPVTRFGLNKPFFSVFIPPPCASSICIIKSLPALFIVNIISLPRVLEGIEASSIRMTPLGGSFRVDKLGPVTRFLFKKPFFSRFIPPPDAFAIS